MKSNESLGKNQLPYYQNNTDMAPSLHVMIEKEDQWIQITSFHPFSWVLLRFESAQPQPVCHPHHPGAPSRQPYSAGEWTVPLPSRWFKPATGKQCPPRSHLQNVRLATSQELGEKFGFWSQDFPQFSIYWPPDLGWRLAMMIVWEVPAPPSLPALFQTPSATIPYHSLSPLQPPLFSSPPPSSPGFASPRSHTLSPTSFSPRGLGLLRTNHKWTFI